MVVAMTVTATAAAVALGVLNPGTVRGCQITGNKEIIGNSARIDGKLY